MYKGVNEFKGGGYYASTRIAGAQAIIYTADTPEECAFARDDYLNIVKPKKWESNLNGVSGKYDGLRLWQTVALVGSSQLKRVAGILIDHLTNNQGDK